MSAVLLAGAAFTDTVVPPNNAALAAAIIQYLRILAIPFVVVAVPPRIERDGCRNMGVPEVRQK